MDKDVTREVRKQLTNYCDRLTKNALQNFDRKIMMSSAPMQILASLVELEYQSEYQKRK